MDKIDPFTREIVKHKLMAAVDEGFNTLENVSGTMVVNEGHDVIVALLTPEGSLLHCGTGVLQHVPCAANAVKGVIDYFSRDPGVFEDDVFMMNDPYAGALHAPDVFIIQPIHYQAKLVAFVASFVHVTDMGGIDPGGFCTSATECYHEGFQTRGLKIIEKGKLRKDVWDTIMNMTRLPKELAMDFKSQIAAGYVVKQRMIRLVGDYGPETVEAVSRGLIAESEELFRQRLSEIPDGVYKTRKYIDLAGKVHRLALAAIKEKDRLVFDFSGTSEQISLSINACKGGAQGGVFPPVFNLLCWDIAWNDGILKCVSFVAPEGTLVNARRPAATSVSSISVISMCNQLGTEVVSKMLGATQKLKDRATGDWLGARVAQASYGLLPNGEFTVVMGTDSWGGAGGARAFKDGIDNGGDMTCIVARMANMESFELRFPARFLYRRVVPDSGGPGKYRGGCTHEFAQVSYGSPDNKFTALAMPGIGTLCPAGTGIFGGLPGCTVEWVQFRNANVSEFPSNRSTTSGQREEYVSFGSTQIADGDILYARCSGGGGYGDPLDREPDLVLNDVLQGLVTVGPAQSIYGVIIDLDCNRVDVEATREQRLALRKQRLGGRDLKVDVDSRAEIPPSGRPLGEYLQVVGYGREACVQCTWCGEAICSPDVRWKDMVPLRKVSVAEAGPGRKDSGLFFLRQYFCPGCATQLDVEVIYGDDPPLYDEVYRWAE